MQWILDASMVCVSIIGAGIGGLTAAVALRDAGFDVGVYEQAIALADEGAGIQITPNAGRVLCHLGLRPALEADAFQGGRFAFRHYRTGSVLRIMDFSNTAQLTGIPYWRVHRADLQRALLTALAQRSPDALHLGCRATGIVQSGDEVTIVFSDGCRVVSDIVVAADGIRSTVRTMLFAQDQPTFSGYVAWRGLVPMARLSDRLRSAFGVSFGGGRTIVNYPIRRGELMNFAAFAYRDAWEEEGWRIPSSLAELQDALSDFHADVQDLIACTPSDRLFKWGVFGRPSLQHWVNGRVALLGDAAHPMLPYLVQGAAMAIEDAMLLARELASSDNKVEMLKQWEAARMPRVNRVSDASAAAAAMFHADVDNYNASSDMSGGRLPDLWTYDAVTEPL